MIRALIQNNRAAASVELLLVTPPLLFLGWAGIELTHRITTQRAVSEIAQLVADNASRAGDSTALGQIPLRESDINDVLDGANLQGKSLDLEDKGRIILSSLEQDASGRQIIHWRRCVGKAAAGSEHSNISNAPTKDPRGIQMRGKWVKAPPREALMVVEVYYDYEPIIEVEIAGYGKEQLAAQAVRLVRDNRDLSGIKSDANAARCTTPSA